MTLVLKHWLLDVWYPQGLLVPQHRYHTQSISIYYFYYIYWTLFSAIAYFIFILTCLLPVWNVSDCIQLRTHPVDTLNAYNYIRQFDLPQKYRVTVCLYQKEVRIDFRYFINENPTIKGQWNYLKRLVPNIDEAMMRAKNWSNLWNKAVSIDFDCTSIPYNYCNH